MLWKRLFEANLVNTRMGVEIVFQVDITKPIGSHTKCFESKPPGHARAQVHTNLHVKIALLVTDERPICACLNLRRMHMYIKGESH